MTTGFQQPQDDIDLDNSDRGNTYRSYLLRLWPSGNAGVQQSPSENHWRANLVCVQTGDTYHFSNLDALFLFLQVGEEENVVSHYTEESAPAEIRHRYSHQRSFAEDV